MSEQMSEKEAQALFAETSKALQENDTAKLSTLMEEKPLENKEEPVLEAKPEVVIPPKEEEKVEDTKEAPVESAAPVEKKEEVKSEEEAKPAPTELELLKEKLDKAEKDNKALRSQAGRIPHVQRRISELDKKLADLAEKAKEPPQASKDVEELLKGVKETDPELADAIAKAIEKATSKVAETVTEKEKDNLIFQRNSEAQVYLDHETNRLLSMYPNAREVFKDPHWESWKNEQSPRVAGLAESGNADDVSMAFQKYAADMAAKFPELNKQQEQAKPAAASSNEAAQKIEAERQRKKETTANVGSPTAQGKTELPSDPKALFEYWSSKIAKDRLG